MLIELSAYIFQIFYICVKISFFLFYKLKLKLIEFVLISEILIDCVIVCFVTLPGVLSFCVAIDVPT